MLPFAKCERKGVEVSTVECLACEHCFPPSMRKDGKMCVHCFVYKDYKNMTKDEANQLSDIRHRQQWVKVHNATANLYFINPKGEIKEVEPAGWWY